MNETLSREPHIILREENHRLNGTGGCNFFNGGYELKEMNRISFTKVAATLMACLNMDIERELLRVFDTADNYTLSADGKTLSLNKARMAPLARFEVVYLK
jgi:heat shock protein HslJ